MALERTADDARPYATLAKDTNGRPTTPAIAAGIERRVRTARDIAALLDEAGAAPQLRECRRIHIAICVNN